MERNGRSAPAIVDVVPFGEQYQVVYFDDKTVVVYEPMHGGVIAASRLPDNFDEALERVAADVSKEGR